MSASKSQLAVPGYPRQPASEIAQLTFPADVELIVIVNSNRDFCFLQLVCFYSILTTISDFIETTKNMADLVISFCLIDL